MKRFKPKLIAIVGGSGSGKSWLADHLENLFGGKAMRLSLDNFYRDRSHLGDKRRRKINFDHPRAIDWNAVKRVLKTLANGRAALSPRYDFATHSRSTRNELLKPKPIIIVDGLWLLHRRKLREYFFYGIFVDSPRKICLQRRLKRDLAERSRAAADVRRQFLEHVVPMHERFVAPQMRRANVVLNSSNSAELDSLIANLKTILK